MGKKNRSSRWLVNLGILALAYAVWQQVKRRAANNPRSIKPGPEKPGWALVTGASSGIGKEMAALFVKQGARVILLARRADKLKQVAAELGDRAVPYTLDISSNDAVRFSQTRYPPSHIHKLN